MAENSEPIHYDPAAIESKWQKFWEEQGIYRALDFVSKQKYYCLVEFPYPSGAGLHVGHVRSYASMDAFVRYKRMQGLNVLYPMGWDAFGLPAENYAIKVGIHPSKTVAENITHFKTQCQSLGLSFDWSREINTTDPAYYKWTQWIFTKLFEAGLAYRTEVSVNWCPTCKTNLADEEVLANGTHERCGTMTEKRLQSQWLLRITAYAQRLLDDLKLVDFSDKIRVQQENWIGRKEGITIRFPVFSGRLSDNGLSVNQLTGKQKTGGQTAENRKQKTEALVIEAFTTRPDTMFGATFIVLAPEHPFVTKILKGEVETDPKTSREIEAYVASAKAKTELDRISEGRKKTGVFTGHFVLNNLNGKLLPVWISDFVLGSFGTGAVVGVPAHDSRDLEFARQFNLPVETVVVPVAQRHSGESAGWRTTPESSINNGEPFEGEGVAVNSGFLNGFQTKEAKEKMMDYLEAKGDGNRVITYHLRDWVFSRQHYWGEPIPVIYCRKCLENSKFKIQNAKLMTIVEDGVEYAVVPIPEDQLPVALPYVKRYQPSGTGESPLATFSEWVKTTCPVCGGPARRETDTMPNWAGSNWYYLAYIFADQLSVFSGRLSDNGLSVNQLTGEQKTGEQAAENREPKTDDHNIFSANQNSLDYWMPVDIYEGGFEHTTLHLLYSRFIYKFLYDLGVVPGPEPYARRRSHGIVLGPDGRKMSKSFGNVINPDDIVKQYGSDTLRIYEMFVGPFEQSVSWSDSSLQGCYRFLSRVYRLTLKNVQSGETPRELKISLHGLIKKVGEDLNSLKFNTAVAALMEFINGWENNFLNYADAESFLLLLSPFAPHLSEELWQRLRLSVFSRQLSVNQLTGEQKVGGQETENRKQKTDNLSIHQTVWPTYDPVFLERDYVSIVVQVNGKLRDRFDVPVSAGENFVTAKAKASPKVQKYLTKEPLKVIYVPGKLINFVV